MTLPKAATPTKLPQTEQNKIPSQVMKEIFDPHSHPYLISNNNKPNYLAGLVLLTDCCISPLNFTPAMAPTCSMMMMVPTITRKMTTKMTMMTAKQPKMPPNMRPQWITDTSQKLTMIMQCRTRQMKDRQTDDTHLMMKTRQNPFLKAMRTAVELTPTPQHSGICGCKQYAYNLWDTNLESDPSPPKKSLKSNSTISYLA